MLRSDSLLVYCGFFFLERGHFSVYSDYMFGQCGRLLAGNGHRLITGDYFFIKCDHFSLDSDSLLV